MYVIGLAAVCTAIFIELYWRYIAIQDGFWERKLPDYHPHHRAHLNEMEHCYYNEPLIRSKWKQANCEKMLGRVWECWDCSAEQVPSKFRGPTFWKSSVFVVLRVFFLRYCPSLRWQWSNVKGNRKSTGRSQHPQECKDPRRQWFLWLVTLTFWPYPRNYRRRG